VALRETGGLQVLVVGLAIMTTAQAVRPVEVPLFDGVVVVDPYRYVTPPSGGEGSPTSARATLPIIEAGKSPSFAVYTSETPPQAELLAKGGELAIGQGATSLTVTIDPIPPPAGASRDAIAGNVYRVAVTDQSGAALALAAGQTITLALRGPAGVAADATIARFSDGAWKQVATAPSGLQDLFLTNADAFGDYAVLGQLTPIANGLDPEILLWALVGAGLTILVVWRFGGRSNPLVPPAVSARRRPRRNNRQSPLKAVMEDR
jgi:hypothetical protein